MTIKTKLVSGITLAAFLAVVVAPAGALASTSVKVKYNGKNSMNMVMVKKSNKTMVMQKNYSKVTNNVGIMQNTGGNKANGNTGAGIVSITTGKATANVSNYTSTGGNYAIVDDCGCEPNDVNVVVKSNGTGSKNMVYVSEHDSSMMMQMNSAWVTNNVGVAQNTGMNSASGNTVGSDGDPSIATGNTNATVVNETITGDNVLGSAMVE